MSKIQQNQQTHSQAAAKSNKLQQPQRKPFNPAQMLESPEAMRSEDVLAVQQTVGNQVVQRALDKDDQRKGLTDPQGNLHQDLSAQIQQKRGGGTPLPENIQKEASKKLGRNFKDVRIHTDESADKLSRTISARAFTIGKDIFFKNGVFAPGSSAGRETIIHELTHVVQQGGRSSASGALKLGSPNSAQEKEADRIGKKHATSVGAAPVGAVQRQGAEEEELQMDPDEYETKAPYVGTKAPAANVNDAPDDAPNMQEPEPNLAIEANNNNDAKKMPGWKKKGPTEAPNFVQNLGTKEEDYLVQAQEEEELQMLPDEDETKAPYVGTKAPAANANDAPDDAPNMQEPEPNLAIEANNNNDAKKMPGWKKKGPTEAPDAVQNLGTKEEDYLVQAQDEEELQMQGDDDDWETDPEPSKQSKLEPVSREKFSELSGQLVSQMKAGEISHGLAKPSIPKAPPLPLPKRPGSTSKGGFSDEIAQKAKSMGGAKQRRSLEKLESARSEKVGTRVSEQYKEDQAAKPKSFGSKLKGLAGKAGSGLLSAGKWAGKKGLGFAKGKLNEGVNHFLGIKGDDKDDDDDKAKAPNVNVTNNISGGGSSGGGGGIGAIMEQYSEVLQENKKLKEELAGLKKTA